ncbi:holo-ACP synthase [Heliobacterium chlorum]|uniref:Holo-[acyl-carrier-protein] synthase n=1 Tax=Heliobacterium chlorum TaxID=2698 RepID=A0ABR7SYN2_HELCL|nr:holo-ACP synthase [Heliobacterium chlorum]MBC9783648.1 holo-ACP synthase [Heliobacterium chlorum]
MAIGCDIVEIARIREAAEGHPRFLERVFSPAEIVECRQKANPWPSFAARFAAKEAVIKAMPGDFVPRLTEMETLRDSTGKPQVHFTGLTAEYAAKSGWKRWAVSLSHERTHAIATVIAWGRPGEGTNECDW